MTDPIIQRKYSVTDIDEMRMAIRVAVTHPGVCYIPKEREEEIERKLRTYMMAGISPDELKEMAHAAQKRHNQWEEEHQKRGEL